MGNVSDNSIIEQLPLSLYVNSILSSCQALNSRYSIRDHQYVLKREPPIAYVGKKSQKWKTVIVDVCVAEQRGLVLQSKDM
jgi:hypothetical protein